MAASAATGTVSPGSGQHQVDQFNSIRNLALSDPSMYMKFVPAILPMLSSSQSPSLELKAWAADFLAETFSSPVLAPEGKQELAIKALVVLKESLETVAPSPNGQPSAVDFASMIKSTVQTVSSVYPFVFRHTVRNPQDPEPWQTMSAIKSNILRRMDNEHPGVRICCLRFVERVVQTQTPGVIADPRRPDLNEVSLALVPSDHPVLNPKHLEAEAQGLLDRALSILQDNHSDALLVTATINGLGALLRTRPAAANRILIAMLQYNPFRLANSPMTPATKLMMKSMEKTVVIFLQHIIKRAPQHPMAPRIEQHIIKLQLMRKEVLDGSGLKRPAEEPVPITESNKRQRVEIAPPKVAIPPPLPPGPLSYAQLYTLTTDPTLQNMNISQITPDIVVPMLISLLRDHVDVQELGHAVNTIRARFQQITSAQQPPVQTTTPLDDEDDYEPDYFPAEDSEQIKNRTEGDVEDEVRVIHAAPASVAVYHLPKPPPLGPAQLDSISYLLVDRQFERLDQLLANKEPRDAQKAFGEPVVRGAMDVFAQFRLIVRTAIRPFASPSAEGDGKHRNGDAQVPITKYVRQRLLQWVLSDWQRRVDFALAWFSEEYIVELDSGAPSSRQDGSVKPVGTSIAIPSTSNYKIYLLRFLADLSTYLGSGKPDLKFLTRLVGNLPFLDKEILNKVVGLADDPERVPTVGAAVTYLVMYRPNMRKEALDGLEEVWRYEGHSKDNHLVKVLRKMRPEAVDKILNTGATVAG